MENIDEKKQKKDSIESKGPHGYGDPYSTKLRKVESEVLIPKLLRQKAKELKCAEAYGEFEKCCKKHQILNFARCKQEAKNMFACYEKWVNDEEFNKECTKLYLEQRKRFRLTGEAQKMERYK